MKTECDRQLTFWKIGKQQVTADFQGGQIVTDAGLLHGWGTPSRSRTATAGRSQPVTTSERSRNQLGRCRTRRSTRARTWHRFRHTHRTSRLIRLRQRIKNALAVRRLPRRVVV